MNEKGAKIISTVFHAYVTLILANSIIIWVDRGRIPNWEVIILILIALPLLQAYLFRKFELISDLDITNRKQRPLFNLAATIPAALMIVLATTTSSDLFLSIALINFSLNVVIGLVSIFWKISGHATNIALLATVVTALFFNWYVLAISLLMIVLVCWSRVVLKRHTIPQVIAGSITGIVITLILL